MGEDEQSENQFAGKRRNGVQMINGDNGERNLDDDYEIIDGVDIDHHTPIDDIASMEDEEDPKKLLVPEEEQEQISMISEPKKQQEVLSQPLKAPEVEVPLRSIPEPVRKELLRNMILDRNHLRAKIKERL